MSNHEELPAFSQLGDSREEVLWEAYQAMLRRRKDARAPSSSGADAPPETIKPPPARENSVRRIVPRSAAAQAAEPGALVFQPLGFDDEDAGASQPPGVRRPSAGRRAALGAAVVLAAGAAVAVALWPRPPIGGAEQETTIPGTFVAMRPSAVAAQRPALPCFVDGRLVGRSTLDDCANRNGVASGSLQVDPGLGPAHPAPSTAAPVVPLRTRRAASFGFAQGRPPRGPAPLVASPVVTAESRFETPFARRSPPRFDAPQPQEDELTPQLAIAGALPASAAPGEGYDRALGAQVPPRRASALAVREFYSALGEGDGARAASVVVPEKREAGPLSARALTRFYGSLRAPLRIARIDPVNDDTVFVRYEFVTPDDRLCVGSATVDTIHRDGDTLIRGIRAFDEC